MKRLTLILLVFSGIVLSQTRTTIFNTGSPDTLAFGYTIDSNNSVANKVYVANDYVLEAMVFYVMLESISGSVDVSFREDDNGQPGELVNEASEWSYTLNPFSQTGYNLIVTTDQCIYLNANQNYWFTIKAGTDETQATWIYSNYDIYNVATSEDGVWTSSTNDFAGAGGVWAEQIYELPYQYGDVNFDFLLNVVDIVNLVGHIMETNILSTESISYADINSDGLINVVDIVQLVNIILTDTTTNPNFTLDDINPASEYYTQSIGPSFFDGQVSCYYFGKQG